MILWIFPVLGAVLALCRRPVGAVGCGAAFFLAALAAGWAYDIILVGQLVIGCALLWSVRKGGRP